MAMLLHFKVIVCFSQKVYVEDNNSGEPIENVAIYSLDKLKSTITNSKGEATIDDFTKSIPIIFQINGYDDLLTLFSGRGMGLGPPSPASGLTGTS